MVADPYLFFLNGFAFFAWSRTASVAFLVAFTVLSLTFFIVPFTSGIFIFGSLNIVSFPGAGYGTCLFCLLVLYLWSKSSCLPLGSL